MIKLRPINSIKVIPTWKKGFGNKPPRKAHREIMSKPFGNIMVIGNRGTGKSTTVLFMVKDHFMTDESKLVVFSPSILSDEHNVLALQEIAEEFGEDNIIVYKRFKTDDLGNSNLIKEIDECKEIFKHVENPYKVEYPRSIFLFDDLGGEDIMRNKELNEFAFNVRHVGALNIFSSQDFFNFDKKIRGTQDILILFAYIPDDRLKDIYDTVQPGIDFKLFVKIYNEATKKDEDDSHNFLFIDVFGKRLRKNFDQEIYIKQI